ncbi:hypothetical protein [Xanthobacter sp. 91]|uniref:hypothetical protein n=1 Tax=Xanthobacter sp. 91 TaxID=1117244 RepID=UPI000495DFE9|nr:hypothetical protein [Xanthobacter sp. 91]
MPDQGTPARALDENDVSQAVQRWLEARGYNARSLVAGKQGIDVAAWHPQTHHRWAIEAKGATSSRRGTRAFGAASSEPRAYNAVSKALLNAVFWSGIEALKDTSLGIACPSDRHFDMWLNRIEPACSILGIAIFRVALDRRVTCSRENMPTRPTALQASKWPMPKSLTRNFEPLPPYE